MSVAIEWLSESQYVYHWKKGRAIYIWDKHGVSPVVNGIFILCIQFTGQRDRRWSEYMVWIPVGLDNTTINTRNGKEKVNSCYRGNKSVDSDVLYIVDQSAIFPNGQSRDKGKRNIIACGRKKPATMIATKSTPVIVLTIKFFILPS